MKPAPPSSMRCQLRLGGACASSHAPRHSWLDMTTGESPASCERRRRAWQKQCGGTPVDMRMLHALPPPPPPPPVRCAMTCKCKCPVATSTSSIAVVMHTHVANPQQAQRLLLSREQLEATQATEGRGAHSRVDGAPRYVVYVVMWAHNATACAAAVHHLGMSRTSCVTDHTVLMAVPSAQRVPGSNRYRTWYWKSCDAGVLGWAWRAQPWKRHQWIWMLEWDLGWSGNLLWILDRYRCSRASMLCHDVRYNDTSWFHSGERDKAVVTDVTHCELSIVRMSASLLARVVEQASRVQHGHGAFCEMRAASLCASTPGCTVKDLELAKCGLRGKPFSFHENVQRADVRIANNHTALFHRVKS